MPDKRLALVTGGTSGVGLALVRHLAANGFVVHFIGTNTDRGRRVEGELGAHTGRFVQLDLSDLGAVRNFADGFAEQHEQLDLLANVAGVLLPKRAVTADGIEKTLAIGHFAPFVLTSGLVPSLSQADHARVVNVSGSARGIMTPSLDFTDLNLERRYNAARAAVAAVHSKTVMTQIWAERLADNGIDVNAFHPGLVRSGLGRHLPWYLRGPFRLGQPLLSPRSRSGEHVCTSEAVTGTTGHLFTGTRGRPLAFSPDYTQRVWDWTTQTVESADVGQRRV